MCGGRAPSSSWGSGTRRNLPRGWRPPPAGSGRGLSRGRGLCSLLAACEFAHRPSRTSCLCGACHCAEKPRGATGPRAGAICQPPSGVRTLQHRAGGRPGSPGTVQAARPCWWGPWRHALGHGSCPRASCCGPSGSVGSGCPTAAAGPHVPLLPVSAPVGVAVTDLLPGPCLCITQRPVTTLQPREQRRQRCCRGRRLSGKTLGQPFGGDLGVHTGWERSSGWLPGGGCGVRRADGGARGTTEPRKVCPLLTTCTEMRQADVTGASGVWGSGGRTQGGLCAPSPPPRDGQGLG